MTEHTIAKRFGLASLEFRDSQIESPLTISRDDALDSIDTGLALICTALDLAPSGLGSCWRAIQPWPNAPTLKIIAHDTRRFGEDGNYAPACGTINLFGAPSSLFHEFGHALDFQMTGSGQPWSHTQTWQHALENTPRFCAHTLSRLRRGGRVRLSDVYLATPHELFARAFECFIIERAPKPWPHAPDCTNSKTYPQGDERKSLCDAIEREVIAPLRTKTGS